MHIMGIVGMPRRYSRFAENGVQIYGFLESLHPLVLFVTVAAIITFFTQFLFLFNLLWSLFKGKKAGNNPWEATTLEWETSSPPPHDNFEGIPPVVYRGPYEYSVPGAPNDFIMQTEPDPVNQPDVTAQEGTGGNGHNGHKH
jgi:cytochrome c oxidase subunit 1